MFSFRIYVGWDFVDKGKHQSFIIRFFLVGKLKLRILQINQLTRYYEFISKISAVYQASNKACTVDFLTGFVNSRFIGNRLHANVCNLALPRDRQYIILK